VQEEPRNQGAWGHILMHLGARHPLRCVARPDSASPAVGSAAQHRREQAELVARALAP
jgi:2-oxoglutarate dehydrogenase E1 component